MISLAALRRVPRVVWALGFVSLLTDVASDMAVPLLPALLGSMGATVVTLGLVEGVAEATSAATKLWGGAAADRGRSARTLVVFGYGLAAIARPLMALVPSGAAVVALRALDRVGKGVRTAPRDLLLARAAGDARGLAFGIHRGMDNLGACLGGAVSFVLLGPVGLPVATVVMLTFLPGLASTLVAWREVPPDAPARAEPTGVAPASPAAFSPALRRLLVATFVFGLGASADTFLVARLLELGLPLAVAPLAWISLQLGKAVLNVPGGALADRRGPKGVLVASWIVYGASYLGFGLASSVVPFWLTFVIYAAYHGLTEGADKAWLLALAPEGATGRALGAHHAILGVSALLANVGFGFLYLRLGKTAFLLGAIPSLVAAAIALTVPRAMPRVDAIAP